MKMSEKKKQQWIMVMHKNNKISDREWGMEVSYSIDHHGVVEAVRLAQEFIDMWDPVYDNLDYKLQGGEW
tara:strand:- start:6677 stop:6886 length:210 start_codon:yes stop_codon:yes gene_type:complete